MEITVRQRNYLIHLWTQSGVECTQYVCRIASTLWEDTLVILVSTVLCPSSHLTLFFLIFSLSSLIYFLFLYETRSLGFSYLFFLCVLLPGSLLFSTAQFHNIVLVSLELFLCLYLSFFFLNPPLLFCDTVYCISFPVWISVYSFSQTYNYIVWFHSTVF